MDYVPHLALANPLGAQRCKASGEDKRVATNSLGPSSAIAAEVVDERGPSVVSIACKSDWQGEPCMNRRFPSFISLSLTGFLVLSGSACASGIRFAATPIAKRMRFAIAAGDSQSAS